MSSEHRIRRYRNWYAKLLRLYPRRHRDLFGEGMEQTFNDICRAQLKARKGLFRLAVWTFGETAMAIIRENTIMTAKFLASRGSTIFLRIVISLVAVAALAVCLFPLPRMVIQEARKTPETAHVVYFLFLIGAYIPAALFLTALYQAFKLLTYADGNRVFSAQSVKALRKIQHCALITGLLMIAHIAAGLAFTAGTGEDTAGPTMLGLIGTLASGVAAAAAAVLQTQVKQVIDLKTK